MIKASRTFNAIVAVTKDFGIGLNGTLPWRLKRDMELFRNVTKTYGLNKTVPDAKNVVIMGRKTWESIPNKFKPLEGRINIVLTSNPKAINDHKTEDLYVCDSLENSLAFVNQELGNKAANVFLIGGKQVYEEGLAHPDCREVFLTRIGQNFECDTFLPKGILKKFQHLETSKTYSENNIPFVFQRYANGNLDINTFNRNYFKDHHEEFQYLNLLDKVINEGADKGDRTGTGTRSMFGEMMRFDLSESFPLLTTKKVFWKGVVEELLWFVKGETNANLLKEKGVNIWDGNTSREFLDKIGLPHREEGDIGPGYGFQWRHFGAEYVDWKTDYTGQGVDQIKIIIDTLKKDPNSRRMILTAWNPAALHLMALPPCHMMAQFYVRDNKLSCLMYQRSCDIGLGVPFNIASYSLLLCMLAQVCGLQRGEFVHVLGDAHIYNNHIEPLKEQAKRIPYPFPVLHIKNKDIKDIEKFTFEDFDLIGYHSHPKIKMEMSA